jgi:hypothetical protein
VWLVGKNQITLNKNNSDTYAKLPSSITSLSALEVALATFESFGLRLGVVDGMANFQYRAQDLGNAQPQPFLALWMKRYRRR